MKNYKIAFAFAVLSGLSFFSTEETWAAELYNIYLDKPTHEHLHALSDLITQTPLTQRIAEDEAENLGGIFINPLRNVERAVRSIAGWEKIPSAVKVMRAIDIALVQGNSTGQWCVYGDNPTVMEFFNSSPVHYYCGK